MFFNGKLALELLAAHQKTCSERYNSLEGEIRKLAETIGKNHVENRGARRAQYAMMWTVAGAVIVGLIVAVWELTKHKLGVP